MSTALRTLIGSSGYSARRHEFGHGSTGASSLFKACQLADCRPLGQAITKYFRSRVWNREEAPVLRDNEGMEIGSHEIRIGHIYTEMLTLTSTGLGTKVRNGRQITP